ncbi:MAG: DUF4288 domain-containing protein [Alphaproteobacteria bacterium]|nr:DUF4288 domain-containing protein [Alphaproteobacteria bacterium]MCW5743818.1 DUF4288 domain-containing protein [Alphaproteobacteria bacterium]
MSKTDQPGDAVDMRWASTRLRMARMVHSRGCEALVDHIVLFYAPFFPELSLVLEIGRALERDLGRRETGTQLVEWRLVEVLTLDVLRNQNPDGAEVYSEWIDGKGSSFGTTFRPETSLPIRRRLVTLRNDGAIDDSSCWYSAKLRMVRMIDAPVDDMFDDQVHTFRSTDFDAAHARAIRLGRAEESSFVNWNDQRAQWRLAQILSLNLLGSGELGDAIDVHSEPAPMQDTDRVPFDTVFHPERSKPRSTGV